MEALFLKLANISLVASWVAVAVLAIRLIFKKVPKWVLCALWAMVAIRLVLPSSFESALSIIPNASPLPDDIIYTARPQIESGFAVIDQAVNPLLESSLKPSEFESANPTQIWSFMLACVWIAGMVGMLIYAVASSLVIKIKLSTATLFAKGIKQSEKIESPFVMGLIKPTIYIPYSVKGSDIAYVVAHEKAHISRLDYIWKPLGFLLLSVYWFNPVMWISYSMLCKDIESACDEYVVKKMEIGERRAYSTALLNCSVSRKTIAVCPLAFGEISVKSRIKSVMNYKKPSFWIGIVSAAIFCAVVLCLMTNPVSTVEIKPHEETTAVQMNEKSTLGENVEATELSVLQEKEETSETPALPKMVETFESEGDAIGKVEDAIETDIESDDISVDELLELICPVKDATVSCNFGIMSGSGDAHMGIDYAASEGTPVMAACDGVIIHADYDHDRGNSILIEHSGDYLTEYNHLSEMLVKSGDEVKSGDIIGYVGSTGKSTGPHLHFGLIKRAENKLKYIEPIYK